MGWVYIVCILGRGGGGGIECVWVNVGEERGGECNGCVGEGGREGECVCVGDRERSICVGDAERGREGRGVCVWVTWRGEGECVCG